MTQQERERIVSRIRKMMLRTEERGATANEAEAAVAEVQRLMLKHQISEFELETEERQPFAEAFVRVNEKPGSYHNQFIGWLLQSFYFVRTVRRKNYDDSQKNGYWIFGDKHNVVIAGYVFFYLEERFNTLWAEYKEETGADRAAMRSFYFGLYQGIRDRLKVTQTEVASSGNAKNALVACSNALTEAFNAKFPGISCVRNSPIQEGVDIEAFEAGGEAAERVRLNKALGGIGSCSRKKLS